MKSIIVMVIVCVSVLGCTTVKFYVNDDLSEYIANPIYIENAINKYSILVNESKLVLIKQKENINGCNEIYENIYMYYGTNGNIHNGSIITKKFILKLNETDTFYTTERELDIVGVGDIQKSKIIETNNESIYLEIKNDHRYLVKRVFDSIDERGRVKKLIGTPTGFTLFMDDKIVGYIELWNDPKFYLLKETENENEVYFFSMLVYGSYINRK
jgi:hypothetical protein